MIIFKTKMNIKKISCEIGDSSTKQETNFLWWNRGGGGGDGVKMLIDVAT